MGRRVGRDSRTGRAQSCPGWRRPARWPSRWRRPCPWRRGSARSRPPKAFSRLRRSTLMVSGMVSTTWYPREAPMARQPDAGVAAGGLDDGGAGGQLALAARPVSSMALATRSFTLPAGLQYSSLAARRRAQPLGGGEVGQVHQRGVSPPARRCRMRSSCYDLLSNPARRGRAVKFLTCIQYSISVVHCPAQTCQK